MRLAESTKHALFCLAAVVSFVAAGVVQTLF